MTNTNMSMLSTPHQNRNICDEIEIKTMPCKNWRSRLAELQTLLGTYCYGIPMSCLSWLGRGYLQKFNKSLDCKSLGVNNIRELVEKMRDKGMVLLFKEPESKKVHVMSARMVQVRRNVSLKPNVQTLLDMNSGVIKFISFEDLYERQFKVKLNYFQYGLTNLDHLCKVLKDILMVEEADPPGAKVIKAKKRKYTNMSMLSSPQQNRNICDEIDFLIDQRLVELEELLGTYCYGIPVSCLSWLERVYLQKFNKSLDCKSLGVNNIKVLVEKMRYKGMVLLFEEPESKKVHVMSARMVQVRRNVSLKPNVQTLLDMNSGVIKFISFEDLYERQFKVKLNYFQYGLTNLDHLCKVLKDILMVEEADPPGAKVIKAKKRKYTNMSMLSSPQQNRNICDEIDFLIDQRLVELEELLGTYCYGIPVSCLSWLERVYLQKFNKSLDCKSLGVNNIKELVEKMHDKGMVLLFEEPESKKVHVVSARVVQVRQNVSLKPNVQTLLDMNSGVIKFISFEYLYERQFKVKLNYIQYGLTNLDHLCKVLKDILMVEEADPPGAKVIKAKKRKYTNMSMLSSPQQNRNICDEIDFLIDQRLVELEELLGNYCYGIPMSCLSWLGRGYLQKFNKSLDCKSLGVNNIRELVEKMRDKGMVLLFKEPESKKVHVMSARMVQVRRNVSLKPNVQTLLDMNSGGIKFISFEDLYERQFKVKLNYFLYGLTNLNHLCEVMKDFLMVEEADPPGAKLMKAKKRKYTNMSMLSSPQPNQIDVLIDQRLVELEELLGTYYDGFPMSCLSNLASGYTQKFNKSLDFMSLGVTGIKELVEKMLCKGMVVLVKGSEGGHVMSARMVEIRQNVFLKHNVQKLLRRHSGEIKFESFKDLYEKQFKVKLKYLWYGLTDLDDLCKVLKDILVVEEANPSRVKVIKAVKNATQGKGRMPCAPQSAHSSYMTNTNMSTLSSDVYQEIQEVLGDFYLGISLSRWSMFEYCYKLKFNKSLESLGVTGFPRLLHEMGERAVKFVDREWEEEYVMSAHVAKNRREICLKPNVEILLCTHGGKIEFDSFENSYEDQFKDELFYGYYGLTDLDHLCQIFENILVVEEKGKKVIKKAIYN